MVNLFTELSVSAMSLETVADVAVPAVVYGVLVVIFLLKPTPAN